jgi:hypothetical protein
MMKDAVLDGFALNLNIRYLPYHYFAACLTQSEVLRRANLYRARWVVMPDDMNTPIPAYDTFEGQIKVQPGAYLWGFQVIQFETDAVFVVVDAANVIIQVTDACTGIPLFSDYTAGSGFSPFSAAAADARGGVAPHLLTQPRLIMEPGLLNVEIANRAVTTLRCQLLLCFSEPCVVLDDVGVAAGAFRGGTQ